MGHADGLCNIYLDESAEVGKAVRVVVDSKVRFLIFQRCYLQVLIEYSRRITHLRATRWKTYYCTPLSCLQCGRKWQKPSHPRVSNSSAMSPPSKH
jgi:hypothetical protein